MSKLPRDISKKFNDKQLIVNEKFKQSLRKSLLEENYQMAKKQNTIITALRKQKLIIPIGAVAAVLLIAGGTYALVNNDPKPQLAHQQNTPLPEDLSDVVPIEQVRTTALADLPGGTIVGVELEQEEGVLVYKVKYSDGTVRIYDAKTGLVVVKNIGSDDKSADEAEDSGTDDSENHDSGDDNQGSAGSGSDDNSTSTGSTSNDDDGDDVKPETEDRSGSNSGHDDSDDSP